MVQNLLIEQTFFLNQRLVVNDVNFQQTLQRQTFRDAQKAVQEYALPLTDPRDAVAQRMINIPYRIIW